MAAPAAARVAHLSDRREGRGIAAALSSFAATLVAIGGCALALGGDGLDRGPRVGASRPGRGAVPGDGRLLRPRGLGGARPLGLPGREGARDRYLRALALRAARGRAAFTGVPLLRALAHREAGAARDLDLRSRPRADARAAVRPRGCAVAASLRRSRGRLRRLCEVRVAQARPRDQARGAAAAPHLHALPAQAGAPSLTPASGASTSPSRAGARRGTRPRSSASRGSRVPASAASRATLAELEPASAAAGRPRCARARGRS